MRNRRSKQSRLPVTAVTMGSGGNRQIPLTDDRTSGQLEPRGKIMKTILALAAVLSIAAAVPTLSDYGSARAIYASGTILAEANGPSPNGHDTAMAEANAPSPGGRDTAMA
jgi:hypothetical protein